MSRWSRSLLSARRALVLAGGGVALASCGGEARRVDVERATLVRERDALRNYLAPGSGALVPVDAFVVVIRDRLVQEVLDGVLPLERPAGESVVLTLRRARVRFRSGLALVQLDGRAALRDNPGVFADLLVSGTLEVLGVDAERGTLATRIQVLGFEAADVGVAGLSPPAERLVSRLGADRAASLNEALRRLEVPVRLAETLQLPPVAEPEVSIEGGSVAFRVEVGDVKVLDDRLWIAVAAEVFGGADAASSGPGTSE